MSRWKRAGPKQARIAGGPGSPGDPGIANLPIGSSVETPRVAAGSSRWHSRGYLPHYEDVHAIQHVTFHLSDSLPADVVRRLEAECELVDPERRDVERRKRIEAWVDAGHGSCFLREPEVAKMVQDALLFFDGQRYRVFAWVAMPNHVHVLFRPGEGWTVAKIVASWKKFTARGILEWKRRNDANREIGGPGEVANREIGGLGVWHREYWDRYMRDGRHFQQAVEYIHQNPVTAGLVARAEDWPWGSAGAEGRADREIGGPGAA